MSLNSVTISGHLGADAELRAGQSGVSVLRFSVAVNERKKQSDGNYGDVTHWIDCVMFGKRAEGIEPYLRRGSKLSLIGHLSTSSYENNGHKIKSTSVIVDDVELQNSKANNQQQSCQESATDNTYATDQAYTYVPQPAQTDQSFSASHLPNPFANAPQQSTPAIEYQDAYADDDIPF